MVIAKKDLLDLYVKFVIIMQKLGFNLMDKLDIINVINVQKMNLI